MIFLIALVAHMISIRLEDRVRFVDQNHSADYAPSSIALKTFQTQRLYIFSVKPHDASLTNLARARLSFLADFTDCLWYSKHLEIPFVDSNTTSIISANARDVGLIFQGPHDSTDRLVIDLDVFLRD